MNQAKFAERRHALLERAEAFAVLYRAGKTLHEIGEQHGITRERVRQLLSMIGLKRADGGMAVRTATLRQAKSLARNERYCRRFGVGFDQYRQIPVAARRAFCGQRRNAKQRGIMWAMTLGQWWAIWQASGKWEQRGCRGDSYVMARIGDSGPYAPHNVYICTLSQNLSHMYLWRPGLRNKRLKKDAA